MTHSDHFFLEKGNVKNAQGSIVDLGLSFASEKDLDDKLWLDPNQAEKDIRFLLKVHGGEITPTLSRLALKAIALPLFIREFEGKDVTKATESDVQAVALNGGALLDAYMDRVGDDSIDQVELEQAIDNLTVMQLVNRSYRSNEDDNTVLLPIGPESDAPSTSFTVLRRKSLGRAMLYVSNTRPVAYMSTPQTAQHRVLIRPDTITGSDNTMHDLAEALIAEQKIEPVTGEEQDLIASAAAHVHGQITSHFDAIQARLHLK